MDRTDRDRLLDHENDSIEEYVTPAPRLVGVAVLGDHRLLRRHVAFYHIGRGRP